MNIERASTMTDREGNDLETRIKSAQERKNKLGRMVNKKAQNMFQQEEQQVR